MAPQGVFFYMPTTFPTTIDSTLPTNNSGANTLNLPGGNDHTAQSNTANGAIVAIENTIGTNSGTNVLKNFTAGDFATRETAAGVFQFTHTGGTFNNMLFGTPTLQAPTINGQGTNSGTVQNGVYGTAAYQGGTATSLVMGTPAIDVITARNSGSAVGFGNSMYPSAGTLADAPSGTFAINAQTTQLYFCVLGTNAGNRTLGTPSNPTGWQQITFAFKTSGSNNGTIVYPAIYRVSQDIGTPIVGTGVGWSYHGWRFNNIDTKWDFIGQSNNLI